LNKPPQISIVIVSYNVRHFLSQCISSILNSICNVEFEIIVVDNNSKDNSCEFIKNNFPNVKLIENKDNLGFGKANNIGFSVSNGKYVLILNPDTIISPDTLQTMYEFMENNIDVGIAGCKVLNSDGSFQLACRRGFPTPWASFTKLFGLQKIFPNLKLFGKYNMTFKSIDESYQVDAVIGAFMFVNKEVIDRINGFDEKYFMYGEDIDFCKKANLLGYKTYYVHTTTIVHYKGESTKRSNINDLNHFYEAMKIYANTYHSNSKLFLQFLKFGIYLRSLIARILRFKIDFIKIFVDSILILISMLIASKILKGDFFWFPEYSYDNIIVSIILVNFLSMSLVGEYLENKTSYKDAFVGLLFNFFILSSLTFYFNQYAFSRGVLLLTILLSFILLPLYRSIFIKTKEKINKKYRLAFIGANSITDEISKLIEQDFISNIEIAGVITVNEDEKSNSQNIIGDVSYLRQIIRDYSLNEIIITSKKYDNSKLINYLSKNELSDIRFIFASNEVDFTTKQIINESLGTDLVSMTYNLSLPRYRIIKYLSDVFFSLILIFFKLFLPKRINFIVIKDLFKILKGEISLVGIESNNIDIWFAKKGIITLPQVGNKKMLSEESLNKLDEYYLINYSIFLDIDIIIQKIKQKNG